MGLRCASTFYHDSRWNLEGGPGNEIGPPAISRQWRIRSSGTPRDNDNRSRQPAGTPCFGYYATNAPGPIAPASSTDSCPRLRSPTPTPAGCTRTGIAKYNYDPRQPEPAEVPALLRRVGDLGEFTQDTLRELKLDAQNRVFKINSVPELRRRPARVPRRARSSATTRWTCSWAATATSTC